MCSSFELWSKLENMRTQKTSLPFTKKIVYTKTTIYVWKMKVFSLEQKHATWNVDSRRLRVKPFCINRCFYINISLNSSFQKHFGRKCLKNHISCNNFLLWNIKICVMLVYAYVKNNMNGSFLSFFVVLKWYERFSTWDDPFCCLVFL